MKENFLIKIHVQHFLSYSNLVSYQKGHTQVKNFQATFFLALLHLNSSWSYNTKSLKLLFKYCKGPEKFNLNKMGNILLQSNQPTIILFRHIEKNDNNNEKQYVFGYFSSSPWRIAPNISGDFQSCIFQLKPSFNKFTSQKGAGQSKFALFSPIVTQRTSVELSQSKRYSKFPGLGIGGSGYDVHRIWIDGTNLKNSYISDEDKTFEAGEIVGRGKQSLDIKKLDIIEIWGLELKNIVNSVSHFRETQKKNNQLLSETNQLHHKDLSQVLMTIKHEKDQLQLEYQKSQIITEEEEEKCQNQQKIQ